MKLQSEVDDSIRKACKKYSYKDDISLTITDAIPSCGNYCAYSYVTEASSSHPWLHFILPFTHPHLSLGRPRSDIGEIQYGQIAEP